MKAVILAGGLGTRLAEETHSRPKPMVEVGGMPILLHIMKIFSFYGVNDFIICLGYKGYFIKEYFDNFHLRNSDVTFNIKNNSKNVIKNIHENWNVTCVDTGDRTLTGGRIKRIKDYLDGDDDFCLTYGDGVSNINITELIMFHKSHGKIATLSSVFPQARFGSLHIEKNQVKKFIEKPRGDGALINGGFFVINKKAVELIGGDSTIWEQEPLNYLANNGELMAYRHEGFWQPMDTLRDKIYLEELWESSRAPWKVWS